MDVNWRAGEVLNFLTQTQGHSSPGVPFSPRKTRIVGLRWRSRFKNMYYPSPSSRLPSYLGKGAHTHNQVVSTIIKTSDDGKCLTPLLSARVCSSLWQSPVLPGSHKQKPTPGTTLHTPTTSCRHSPIRRLPSHTTSPQTLDPTE